MKQVYIDPNKEPEENTKEAFNISRDEEQLKKTFKSEKKKLSQMQGSEKAEYIFMYYKFHIIGIVAAVAAIIYIIHHILTYTVPCLYIDVLNSFEANDAREAEITEYVGMDKHDVAEIMVGVETTADPMAMYKQIDIYTAAGQIDIMFSDREGAEYAGTLGTTQVIEDMLPANLYELWKDRVEEMPVHDVNTEDTFYTLPVLVNISGTKVADYFGLMPGVDYMMISDLSGNEEYLQKFFQMLYDIETGAYSY